ncbi:MULTISPECIES: efflux RND transporter periplasmic adaptor subunit [Halomonas]|uniref:efflux RND transporter periplasmic adaptor subunit n=1 Tax=Halomonas TaxID=2745 RepID=UPI001C967C4E|nr:MULTISPECIES: efflux RND transporter periplasmic adaptor subunit [Halomonas]MBY6206927.1 efflux RND transporter periplasmic adaptor subunit [Halomonas sp. DP3Y7-2]MBY6230401.1 efflux RND transporter periplasmic adaptor subunit [Halomonas sp. DP3Y7-1]MCA0918562.1 efflux RND transporter periplasmic adaptor subunit [Halomonas denitrificans]
MKTTMTRGRPWAALAAALLLAGCGQDEGQSDAQAGGQPPAKPIEVAELAYQDIPLDKSYPSKLMSEQEVTLVARVTGVLEERKFEPGDQVEKGDSLYTIEPDLYEATVAQREADLASAQAEVARADRDANRFQQLAAQNSVSRQQVDQALADARVARASVAQAEAALKSAQLDLNYADVTAPVSGVIGLSEVNVGNLVSPNTELATITPLDPLEVRFQMPQNDAFELRRQLEDMSIEDIVASLEAFSSRGEAPTVLSGHLDFLGSRVDAETSTVQAEATFANPDGAVLPGQYVRVKIQGLARFGVLAVPELALTQGLMGPQVYVLDDDNVARARPVQLGELAGPWQIILDGVEPGERVVVGDPGSLKPGTPIDPQPFDGDAEALMQAAQYDEQQAQQGGQGGAGQAPGEQAEAAAGEGADQASMEIPQGNQEAEEAEGEGNE